MKNTSILFIAAVLLAGGCSKSGSDGTGTDSSMQFQLKADNALVVVNKPTAGTILWTSGSASSTQIKFEAKKNGSEIEYKSIGLKQIDLFSSVLASLGSFTIPAGTYTEIEYKITINQNGSNPALELNGQYTNASGGATQVVFTMNNLFDLKAEQSNVTVSSNSSFTALTTLNLSFVSSGITQAMMNSATLTSGKILINASSNVNLYTIIVNNLQQFHHVDVSHH